jgi:hypothetical protein
MMVALTASAADRGEWKATITAAIRVLDTGQRLEAEPLVGRALQQAVEVRGPYRTAGRTTEYGPHLDPRQEAHRRIVQGALSVNDLRQRRTSTNSPTETRSFSKERIRKGTTMARSFGLRAKLDFVYVLDVDSPVGKNCPNHREDVLLVQYLLAVWLAHEKDIAKLAPLLAGTPPMVVDGRYGPNTAIAITTFETFHSDTIAHDGQFHPINQTIRTRKMFLLNLILFFAGGLRGGVPETRIPFPKELIHPLYR